MGVCHKALQPKKDAFANILWHHKFFFLCQALQLLVKYKPVVPPCGATQQSDNKDDLLQT